MSGELRPKKLSLKHRFLHTLLGFLHNNCVGVACIVQATPGLLNVCVTGCDGFARNCVSRSSFIIFFINLVSLKAV